MDYKITQEQAYKLMNTILDKQNIKIDILYRYDYGYEKIG
jgi:predicted nucleic-acid-binding protein